ncbi:uncharacterized protein LOC101736617 [Bombyx mori]|uniref:Uncharacterized protein n=1 Tax=Bombyx mori TaxID=7091 RepID=A0A8R2M2X8_BOMMO|nr:uncharacterized protein LOC101736617 isoform X1 [Bombyx mori]
MASSGSWRGGAQPNIIDLDRYMRAGVRPADDVSDAQESDRLIVDAGGLSRELRRSSSDSSREHTARTQCKRYSHDSGLSDGSYVKRRHRAHRRHPASDVLMKRQQQPLKEDSSIRDFRVVCEKALLEQQKQLARVTQLCEKLTERQATEIKCDRTVVRESSDSSELSSTSRSTGDERRKDHNRTQKCKTYKIIMNKLDELNRVFVQRGRSPPARPPLCPVNFTDKVVTTDVDRSEGLQKPQIMNQTILNKTGRCSPYGREHIVMRSMTQAYAVDIAPKEVSKFNGESPNVLIESVVKSGQSSLGSRNGNCDPRCGFDLNDPVHLYSQAKSLGTKYTHTVPGSGVRCENPADVSSRSISLCAVCRGYWKSFWKYFSTQLNEGHCKSF